MKKFFDNTKESVIQSLIKEVVNSATKYKKDLRAAQDQYLLNNKPDESRCCGCGRWCWR